MLVALCAAFTMRATVNSGQLATWGKETLANIDRNFKLPTGGLYADAYQPGHALGQPAFDWGVGVYLSALNAGAEMDPSYIAPLKEYVNAVNAYWDVTPPVPGFNVLPHSIHMDRYYDDNEWMVMVLSDASRVTDDLTELDKAKATFRYVLSGEDNKLGDGIYWHENDKKSKNTCSNAPAAAACMALYERTHDEALLARAEELYAWTKNNLQDPADGLFWDSVGLNGTISKAKWSYNTALMIRTASALFKATHIEDYRTDAHKMFEASRARWLDPATGALKDDAPFAHLLLESWVFLEENAPNAGEQTPSEWFTAPLVYLHDHGQANGFYGKKWNAPPTATQASFQLIDQAAAARGYFVVARYLATHKVSD